MGNVRCNMRAGLMEPEGAGRGQVCAGRWQVADGILAGHAVAPLAWGDIAVRWSFAQCAVPTWLGP